MQKALIIIGFLTLSTVSLAQDDQSQTQAQANAASSWASQLFSAFGVAAPSKIFISQSDTQQPQSQQDSASQQDGFNPFSNATKVSF